MQAVMTTVTETWTQIKASITDLLGQLGIDIGAAWGKVNESVKTAIDNIRNVIIASLRGTALQL